MSGGRWNYQQWRIADMAESVKNGTDPLTEFIKAVAESEHIVDWAECGDGYFGKVTVPARPVETVPIAAGVLL